MFTIYTLLHLRKRHPELFLSGAYIPLPVPGASRKFLAYARSWKGKWLMIIVPVGIGADKKQASSQGTPAVASGGQYQLPLPKGYPTTWMNVFTGERLVINGACLLGSVLSDFPVAVLESAC